MTLNFDINWLAAIVAAVAAFAIGSVWYSPVLFSKTWQRETKLTDADIRGGNMMLTFGGAFVLTLVASIVLAAFLGPAPGVGRAALAGFVVGAGIVSTSLGITFLFERKSLTLFAIDAGYMTVLFTAMGLILGLWP